MMRYADRAPTCKPCSSEHTQARQLANFEGLCRVCAYPRRLALRAAVGLATLALGSSAVAQSADAWPTRPVNVVVGFSAGGPTDTVARILADGLSAKFGQSFVVDNKTGAAGTVAAGLVKQAQPDGYTLMLGSSSTLSILPMLQKTSYDTLRDFTTIGLVASYPYFLVVPASSSITTLDELIAQGRQPTSRLNYGSAGNGTTNHLAGEWFKHEAKIQAQHVPYRGDSAAVADLIAGRLDFALFAGAVVLPQVQAGNMRILASASATPGLAGAGIPTLGERFKNFSAEPWNGLMAPAGLSPAIVTRVNAAMNEIMHRPEVVARLKGMEQYPLTGSPQQFTEHIKTQTEVWRNVIATTGIQVN